MKKYFVLAAIAGSLIMISCTKAPQAEMDAAKAAIEQAKNAQANLFLATEYNALQDSINHVSAVIESQKSKVFGNFKGAKQSLLNVTSQANELVEKTSVRKEEVKNEIATSEAQIATLMDENYRLVAIAPKGKEGKEALEAIKSDLASIDSTTPEIQTLLQNNELIAAQSKANAAKQKASTINAELKNVMEKYMAKR